MAWKLLPEDYTDAAWSGLKRYLEVNNEDGTLSFQDVTAYSHKDKSFFGAKDANRMNEALNILMSMVESGTDLYSAFQNYFAIQKTLFEQKGNATQAGFERFVEGLMADGEKELAQMMSTLNLVFMTWFEYIKDQLGQDAAGNLQNQCTELDERLSLLEHMTLQNDFSVPIATDDEPLTLLTDDLGYAIVADWKYEEV